MSKEELNKDNLIKDVDFIYDAKQFLYDREDYQSDDNEDIYDRYLEHFRYQNVNEVSAVRDMYLAQDYEKKGDDEGLARMGRLMSTFENQDTEFTSETVTDYLGGVFTAPSTYASMFSFGAGKAGALAAQQGIKFGIKEIIKGGAKKTTTTSVSGNQLLNKLSEIKNRPALKETFTPKVKPKSEYRLKNQLRDYVIPNILKLKILLVSILIFVAVVSLPLLIISGNVHFKHGLEWNYFIGVIIFYLLTSILWKKKIRD